MIGGFLAQGLGPYEAACLGVHVHAEAAERISETQGSSGLMASDLHAEIPFVMDDLRSNR